MEQRKHDEQQLEKMATQLINLANAYGVSLHLDATYIRSEERSILTLWTMVQNVSAQSTFFRGPGSFDGVLKPEMRTEGEDE